MYKRLSIIIVNFRSWPYLRDCLLSLSPINWPFEIIVVDNNSQDGLLESFKIEFPLVHFVESPENVGFGAGCHLGALHSTGNYLLFLNPDTLTNAEAIDAMMTLLETDDRIGITSVKQHKNLSKHFLLFPSLFRLSGLFRIVDTQLQKNKFEIKRNGQIEYIEPDWVSASVLMISKDNYEKIGGWNKRLWMYFEDPDLCKKISELGKKVTLITNQMIEHKHGGATRSNINTESITKTEVTISRHVYIEEHFNKINKKLAHFLLILEFLALGTLKAILGLLFFFVPAIGVQLLIWKRRMKYYSKVYKTSSWLSPNLILQ